MADLLSMTNKKNDDKQKALDSALSQIERQFGKGSIMKWAAKRDTKLKALNRLAWVGYWSWYWGLAQRPDH